MGAKSQTLAVPGTECTSRGQLNTVRRAASGPAGLRCQPPAPPQLLLLLPVRRHLAALLQAAQDVRVELQAQGRAQVWVDAGAALDLIAGNPAGPISTAVLPPPTRTVLLKRKPGSRPGTSATRAPATARPP